MSEPDADRAALNEDLADLYDNAPFGYLSTAADGTTFGATFPREGASARPPVSAGS